MAPCDLERRETVGDISISQYRIWQQFGGGYDIVARNGDDLERVHTRSLPVADETFAMLVGKYSGMAADAGETMCAFAMPSWYSQRSEATALAQMSQDARDLRVWATGR